MISTVKICYSLKWVTCHINMSVCVVMLLPAASIASKTSLGNTFEALWERLEASSERFWEAFGRSFGHFDQGTGQETLVFSSLGRCWHDFLPSNGLQGAFWVVFGPTFGLSESRFFMFFVCSVMHF